MTKNKEMKFREDLWIEVLNGTKTGTTRPGEPKFKTGKFVRAVCVGDCLLYSKESSIFVTGVETLLLQNMQGFRYSRESKNVNSKEDFKKLWQSLYKDTINDWSNNPLVTFYQFYNANCCEVEAY